jgi:hypothetical protein
MMHRLPYISAIGFGLLAVNLALTRYGISDLRVAKPADKVDVKSTPAPHSAIVLFDGKNLNNWVHINGRDKPKWKLLASGAMEVHGGNIMTRRKFGGSFKLHVEFRVPYLPDKKGQQRGNSGISVQGRYEVQVLDSYGLKSTAADCGAIFGVAAPRVNACKAPTIWQSYDIEFHAPRRVGMKKETARMTVYQNGILIHNNVKLTRDNTHGGLGGDIYTPGPIMLQDWGNPVQYRNIWLVSGTGLRPGLPRKPKAGTMSRLESFKAGRPAPPGPKVGYVLGIKPVQRIRADFAIRLKLPRMKVKDWCVLTARPPVLIGQKAVAVSGSPRGKVVTEQSPERRQVLRSIVAGKGKARHSIVVKTHYRATLYARQLLVRQPGDGSAGPPDLKPVVRANYLRSTLHLDYRTPGFGQWLVRAGLRRARGEGEIPFAQRAFRKIAQQELTYACPARFKRASEVVRARQGDCGSFANVYVSTLRANGIPARALIGRWATSTQPADKTGGQPFHQTHVKTEFFARGVGWVPVDPTCGIFGEDGGDFLTLHVDPDMDVPTKIAGKKPVEAMQPWAYYVTGFSGNFNGFSATGEKWVVHGERLHAKKPNRRGKQLSLGRPHIVTGDDGDADNDNDDGNDDNDGDDDASYQQWHKKHKSAVIIVAPKKKKK